MSDPDPICGIENRYGERCALDACHTGNHWSDRDPENHSSWPWKNPEPDDLPRPEATR